MGFINLRGTPLLGRRERGGETDETLEPDREQGRESVHASLSSVFGAVVPLFVLPFHVPSHRRPLSVLLSRTCEKE